jgi:hypothetical protein
MTFAVLRLNDSETVVFFSAADFTPMTVDLLLSQRE